MSEPSSDLFQRPGLHRSPLSGLARVRRDLETNGWKVLVLPTTIRDTPSFFKGVRDTVDLDPPVLRNSNWDALDDSLWEGLHTIGAERIALIWPDATTMAERDPRGYEIAIQILTNLPRSLGDDELTVGEPKQLSIIVGY